MTENQENYADMTSAQVAVLVSTWKWRLIKAGYKNSKDFCEKNDIYESNFSFWVTGKQKPSAKNIEKIEQALKKAGG